MISWKNISFYNNFSISNTGLIKNNITNELIQLKNMNCYITVYLSTGNKKTSKLCYVHRLVESHYIDNPENKKLFENIDRNK